MPSRRPHTPRGAHPSPLLPTEARARRESRAARSPAAGPARHPRRPVARARAIRLVCTCRIAPHVGGPTPTRHEAPPPRPPCSPLAPGSRSGPPVADWVDPRGSGPTCHRAGPGGGRPCERATWAPPPPDAAAPLVN